MKTSENINEIAKAMSIAQLQLKPAIKDSINPHFKSKYSDMSSVWDAIREPIASNGLTIWQDVTTEDKKVSVTTRIIHTSGQWVEFGPLCVPMSKLDAHGVGSAISYGKRYALCAAVGVVSSGDDDDANHAVGKPTVQINKLSVEFENFIQENPEKYEYIKVISKNSGKSISDIISQIFVNMDRFNDAYEKWQSKKPSSMDEVEN